MGYPWKSWRPIQASFVKTSKRRCFKAAYFAATDHLLETLLTIVQAGDVVLFMSNGGFDNLPERLVGGLREFPLSL
jgi:UDP-N-acetylmuramate-alanine ligase